MNLLLSMHRVSNPASLSLSSDLLSPSFPSFLDMNSLQTISWGDGRRIHLTSHSRNLVTFPRKHFDFPFKIPLSCYILLILTFLPLPCPLLQSGRVCHPGTQNPSLASRPTA
ncbi:unnamed protein product [Rangifer tarandus platyrhynchus]|uniref:Uncharacterized protein n=1 Tax=Rangifer tarandus platyrhynchus TaxID=3082113 RepID=A0ABN8ZUN3_RANTA|nr:unnamed protein product [Rangifer tarandus platyrhynchus]